MWALLTGPNALVVRVTTQGPARVWIHSRLKLGLGCGCRGHQRAGSWSSLATTDDEWSTGLRRPGPVARQSCKQACWRTSYKRHATEGLQVASCSRACWHQPRQKRSRTRATVSDCKRGKRTINWRAVPVMFWTACWQNLGKLKAAPRREKQPSRRTGQPGGALVWPGCSRISGG